MCEDAIPDQTTPLAGDDIITNTNDITSRQISSQVTAPSMVEGCGKGGTTMCNDDLLLEHTNGDGGGDIICNNEADRVLDMRPCVGTEQIVVEELIQGVSSNGVMSTEAGDRVSCEFTRCGICKSHNLKGDMMSRKVQVWKKKRYG